MAYKILILRHAQKEMAELPVDAYQKVKLAIYKLAENPLPRGNIKLKGRDGWRIRVGEYRVVYEINNNEHIITVIHTGHRRDIYR